MGKPGSQKAADENTSQTRGSEFLKECSRGIHVTPGPYQLHAGPPEVDYASCVFHTLGKSTEACFLIVVAVRLDQGTQSKHSLVLFDAEFCQGL